MRQSRGSQPSGLQGAGARPGSRGGMRGVGTDGTGGRTGVCPGVLEVTGNQACVYGPSMAAGALGSRNAEAVRGPGTHLGGSIEEHAEQAGEESGPGPTLCQLPCADPFV